MESLRHKIARLAVRNRWVTLGIALAITLFFGYGLLHIEARTIFSDLFPKTHPFVQAFKDHPNFGNPLTVTVMVKRTDGHDIYDAQTMDKLFQMSRDIDLVPGVDHDQIVSIATAKARYTVLTADGIYSNPVMDDQPPKTADDLAEIRRRVNESSYVSTFLVSQDGSAAIINATFIEGLVDYGVVFDKVQELVAKYSDANHRVYVAGWPMLTGWVYHYGSDTVKIFAVTLGLMFVCLLLVMRNVAGVLTPVIVSGMSAVWGFGFVGWIHHPVEPLLMVVPLLLIARSFSHSVQATERYYELLRECGDKRKAAEMSLAVMIAPILASQLASLMQSLPAAIRKLQALVTDPNHTWLAMIFGDKLSDTSNSLGDLVSQGAGWAATFAASLWSGGKALFSVLSLLVITPVVAFYLLCDWDRLVETVDSWIPLPHRETVHGLMHEIDVAIAAFVRGQAGICLILGSFYAIALMLIGLNFGFLIGFISGLISFIPYVGSITGFLLGCIVAVAQFWPQGMPVVLVVCVFLVGQLLEGYVLAPKLVGEKVGLHPVWLMFALFAFGSLFGFTGLVLAVPLAAAIGVLCRYALKRYLESPLYKARPIEPAEGG